MYRLGNSKIWGQRGASQANRVGIRRMSQMSLSRMSMSMSRWPRWSQLLMLGFCRRPPFFFTFTQCQRQFQCQLQCPLQSKFQLRFFFFSFFWSLLWHPTTEIVQKTCRERESPPRFVMTSISLRDFHRPRGSPPAIESCCRGPKPSETTHGGSDAYHCKNWSGGTVP